MANKDNEGKIVIPLDTGFNDRVSEFLSPPGTLNTVVNLRQGINPTGIMRLSPSSGSTVLTFTTSSIAPGAFVPSNRGHGLFVRPDIGEWVISEDGANRITSPNMGPNTSSFANAWFPTQVINSHVPLVINSTMPNVTACRTTSGYRVFAAQTKATETTLQLDITLTVENEGGAVIMPPTVVATMGTPQSQNPYPIALTQHTNDTVALWYHYFTAAGVASIKMRLITVSASGVSVGGEYAISSLSVGNMFAVDATGYDSYAYLLQRHSSATGSVYMRMIDVTLGSDTVTPVTYTHELDSGSYPLSVAVHETSYYPYTQIAAGWVNKDSVVRGSVMSGSILQLMPIAPVSTRVSNTRFRDTLVVQWCNLTSSIGACPVWIASDTTPITSSFPQTTWVFDKTSPLGSVTLDGVVPVSQGAQWRLYNTDTTYPLVPMTRIHQTGSTKLDTTFVEDPSLEIYTARPFTGSNSFVVSSIARLGVDSAYGAVVFPHKSMIVNDDVATVVYPTTYLDSPNLKADNVACTDIALWQHRTSSIYHGSARSAEGIIAAGQPMYWDGQQVVEVGFLHRPYITGAKLGGTGPALTGNYTFYAVTTWTDALGQKHRSSPSEGLTLSLAATSPFIYVGGQDTVRNGSSQRKYGIELYATNGTTSTPYMLNPTTAMPTEGGTIYPGMTYYNWVTSGSVGSPVLYSRGDGTDELLPEAPGALWDVDVVNDRVWAIDAENRSLILPSKIKVSGYPYEFNRSLGISLPSAAGRAVAIRELNGVPVFFCENGVYVVTGDGPDNTGGGSIFNSPQRISTVKTHPMGRNSVVRTSDSIFFRTTRGYAVLNAGLQVQEVDQILPRSGSMGIYSSRNEEVWLLSTGSRNEIVNVGDGIRPTTWNADDRWLTGFFEETGEGNERLFLASDMKVNLVPNTEDQDYSVNWRIKTNWIAPGAPTAGTKFDTYELVGLVTLSGSNTITVEQYLDYKSDLVATQTFTAEDISKSMFGAPAPTVVTLQGRVAKTQSMRAIKFDIRGYPSGSGVFVPMYLTVFHNPQSGHEQRRQLTPKG